MIKFDTDKLIRVAFPPFAGGKFLINSLGLSNKCLFQSSFFAQTQLAFPNKDFQEVKFNYLLKRIKISNELNTWNDLGLGCHQLLQNEKIDFNNSEKFFFLVCHNERQFMNVNESKNIILFYNTKNFQEIRFKSIQQKYLYNYFDEEEFSDSINRRKEYWDNDFLRVEKILMSNVKNVIFYWNTENYFSKSKTLSGIEKLYQQLGLNDYREDLIGNYYDLWTEAIGISEYCDYS